MSLITENEARKITDKMLGYATAPATEVQVNFTRSGNTRFARNEVTTSGSVDTAQVVVQSFYGLKKGVATTDQYDDAALAECVARAEELARFAPDDKETMPPLPPQKYPKGAGFFDEVADLNPDYRAKVCGDAIQDAASRDLTAAGFLQNSADTVVLASSNGNFCFDRTTGVAYSLTVRSSDATGSGWGGGTANRLSLFDPGSMTSRAVDLAMRTQKPVALEPGSYTTILPAECVADLATTMAFGFGARGVDEGRSFLSQLRPKIDAGEKIFSEKVNIFSDPSHPLAPSNVFDNNDNLPLARTDWVREGVIKNLIYGRYWAKEKKKEPVPQPNNLIMTGGKSTIDEMVASTKRGLLATRFWYIRFVDPQTCLMTGLTRDGLFLIEDGKVTKPVKNFRWNETPVKMLRNIELMGPERRVVTSEADLNSYNVFPDLKVTDFTFSSLSDAV